MQRSFNPQGRTAFCTEPTISSFQGTNRLLLGFRFIVDKGIIQRLKPLLYEDSASKLSTCDR